MNNVIYLVIYLSFTPLEFDHNAHEDIFHHIVQQAINTPPMQSIVKSNAQVINPPIV
jgi:hypothetical protein